MTVLKEIFREYDIRGIYSKELSDQSAFLIGKALGTTAIRQGSKRFIIGRDNRECSEILSRKLIEGLNFAGCDTTDTGITLTPVIHFLTCTQNYDFGVSVTASHNPKQYGGFRIDKKNAISFAGIEIRNLYNMILKDDFVAGDGTNEKRNLTSLYINFFKTQFHFKKHLKVALDCGYGTSGIVAPEVFSELGENITTLYCTLNGSFPKGIPDPEDSVFLQELSNKVLESGANVGFAFDTDADRFGVVDEKGNIYSNDRVLMLLAKEVLKKNPGGEVIYDVKSTQVLEEVIKEFGGNPRMMQTGHSHFINAMKSEALVGAELSGHTFFSDKYFGYDDGVYASCRILDILDNSELPLSSLMLQFPKRHHSSEIKIAVSDRKKVGVLETIKKRVHQLNFVKIVEIDGVRAYISDTGWFLVRVSNTTPNLSLRIEGENKQELEDIKKILKNLLKYVKLDTNEIDSAGIFYS